MARVTRQLELRGVFASAITPRRKGSQDADFSAALDLFDFLAQGGVQAICVSGATGEFIDCGFSERQRIVYLGVKRSRVPLIVGVSHSTIAGSLQLADEAVHAGADGLILMPPFFYPYSQCEIEAFYRQFARETGDAVPILIHNLPQTTSGLEIETVRKLLDSGRFAGIKDSSGDWEYFEQLRALKRQRPFALFNGADSTAVRALREGADGIISPSACALPELLIALARPGAPDDLNERLMQFIEWSNKFPFPVAIKRAVELRGQKAGPPLNPLSPQNVQALDEFSKWFEAWLPLTIRAAAHA